MAGIGFEFRKLFSKSDSTLGDLKAIAYSTLVSVGPWLITTISLNFLMIISREYIFIRDERVLFMSTVLYCFIFSQLLATPWQYVVTRYMSDCIYQKRSNELRKTYIGVIKIIIIMAFIMGSLFLRNSPLPYYYKKMAVILFTLLSASWIGMCFVNVLKNYKFVAFSYFAGNLLAMVLGFYLIKNPIDFPENFLATNLIFAYTMGILLTFLLLSYYLLSAFKEREGTEFGFLKYLKGYSSLFFMGLFYILGIWVHLFIVWTKGEHYIIAETFTASPFYEVALFYAFFITIPSMVYFVVFLETKFFPDYKTYYAHISYKGTLEDIDKSLATMMDVLKREMFYCMEMQFFISISLALLSKLIFENFGLDLYLLDLFRISLFSAFCAVFISMIITIFLYFDARIQALMVSFVFFITDLLFSLYFVKLGNEYTGVGFFLSSFITLLFANILLDKLFKNISYTTFYRQNFKSVIRSPFLDMLDRFLSRKAYLPVIVILLLSGFLNGCSRYDERGFNQITRHNWHTMSTYGLDGYDIQGYNSDGADRRGFTSLGWNLFTDSPYDYYGFDFFGTHSVTGTSFDEEGFDVSGYSSETDSVYNKDGFTREGIHKDTGMEFNKDGWNRYGVNKDTGEYYDHSGYNIYGYNIEGYDREGKDTQGFDREGWNRDGLFKYTGTTVDYRGFEKDGYNPATKSKYDERGFNFKGIHNKTGTKYDLLGFDTEGIHKDTKTEFDVNGWTWYGLNSETRDYYDVNGYNKEGYDKSGYDDRGLDSDGYNRSGWSRKGIFKGTGTRYDYYGFDMRGINKETGSRYDKYGWNSRGISKKTGTKYDILGFDRNGLHQTTGKNYSKDGWKNDATHIVTGTLYDPKGYDIYGYDKDGYDRRGYNSSGIDRNGFDREGRYVGE
ncbi:exopolysaccharide Pel transporter PelG [uncultured Ilyobacter sp.]|uniref:exopolysaccharide Pel transporter PelG n=1 Tax=uncultured Ilyobacter sp. TaxID=544433 RepID=UPI0029C00AC2|nr:exopolysaccharide Pel transporter PelG [uncultured Ilyobacter sp.]